ncbi:Cox family DNA-binding protein [Lelliottia nimipressuralis]|uniref:Cox family DNA-binding protein n=1 Tax=Lelliottia nimipressuralis TaxID=69220 RepID=UPI0028993100|nr:Cox family DNA-binding protein [Lelliottia nimipressuralis]
MKEASESTAADLVTPELFASKIGKTPAAVRKMAQEGKLPVIRMRDPARPDGKPEVYIALSEWNNYTRHLVQEADAEWHGWKDRLSTEKLQWNPNKEGKSKGGSEK